MDKMNDIQFVQEMQESLKSKIHVVYSEEIINIVPFL